MSARLTPDRIAEREMDRLAKRIARLQVELSQVVAEHERWAAVLHALNGGDAPDDYTEE